MLCINFYQKVEDGSEKFYILFKFMLENILEMLLLLLKYEIFVYSFKVEGVYLCGGCVVCGGLCWLDCQEDFRMEILGLVKV